MTQQPAAEPATGETKPRYEPPQVIDLSRMAQAQGGNVTPSCRTGTGVRGACVNGPVASSSCTNGTVAPPV